MKKSTSIFLSVLMLVSSSGIAYAQHFCGGMEIMSKITLGENHLSCGMESEPLNSDCSSENTDEDHDCCDSHITKIQIDDNFAKASFDLDLSNTFAVATVSLYELLEVDIASVVKNFFADYNPPPLERDLNILYDTFLI